MEGTSLYMFNVISDYYNQFKNDIENLIEDGRFDDANHLIREYRRLDPRNIEIYSIESVVAIMEGKMNRAEQALRMGLTLDKDNPDLWFNFGYFHEIKGDLVGALHCYQNAKINASEELIEQINDVIVKLSSMGKEIPLEEKECTDNKTTPIVSVLIPTYNMKEYLKEAIDSVLAQDFSNLEIIIADDCSTDGTFEVMSEYKDDPRVRYIQNDVNLGSSINSQQLLYKYARAKYVLFINHDDYLTQTDYISKAVAILESNQDISLVFANVKIMNTQSPQGFNGTNLNIESRVNGFDYFLNYQKVKYPPIPSTLTSMFRKDDAFRMGCLLEEVYSQDTFLYLKLMLLGDVAFIQHHVGVYRVHGENLSNNMPSDRDFSTVEEFERLYTFALAKGMNVEDLEVWLQIRVFNYIRWRLTYIWPSNRKYALELLLAIADQYNFAFDSIVSNLQWANPTK